MATKIQNLRKKYSKINSSEAVLEVKLKLCRIVLTLVSTKVVFVLPFLKHFGCYGNLKLQLTYNGKVKIEIYCYLIANINFD